MPVKIQQAYNIDKTKGDDLDDSSLVAFEEPTSDTSSNSWGATLGQLVSYLTSKFYTRAESEANLAGKIPLITSPTENYAVTQNTNGTLKSTGLPLATIKKNTVTVSNWAQNNHTQQAHGLADVVPDVVSVKAVFQDTAAVTSAGWTPDDTIVLDLTGGSDLSGFGIYMNTVNFQIYNSCTSANALLIPHKSAGTSASVAMGQDDVWLDITFISIKA